MVYVCLPSLFHIVNIIKHDGKRFGSCRFRGITASNKEYFKILLLIKNNPQHSCTPTKFTWSNWLNIYSNQLVPGWFRAFEKILRPLIYIYPLSLSLSVIIVPAFQRPLQPLPFLSAMNLTYWLAQLTCMLAWFS